MQRNVRQEVEQEKEDGVKSSFRPFNGEATIRELIK